MTVADLETRMDGREFAEWSICDRIKADERNEAEKAARRMAQTEAAARRG